MPADPAAAPADPRAGAPPAPEGAAPSFLAYVVDEESETALRGGLLEAGAGLQIRRGNAAAATRALSREPTPAVLLVDVSGEADPIEALDALARVCAPEVRVLVVGEAVGVDLYRRMVRELGVAEYLEKPLTRDAVSRLLAPHLATQGAAARQERGGRIVTVLGARGGCGATTVATSLALHLAEVGRGHVALLDLHLRGGTTGLLLGVRSGTGLRVALEDPERADALFLDRSSIAVADRVRLIAADEPMDSLPLPTEAGMRRLLDLLTARFNFIVVDLRAPPGAIERMVMAAARHRVVVLGPDVAGIRDALALRRAAAATGAGQVLTVLNRAGLPGGLKAGLVTEGLGGPPDATIPDLPKELPRAAHLGRPAVREVAALRRALAPLTQEVAAVRAAPGGRSPLARLLGRRPAA